MSVRNILNKRLVFVSGKGGVGKTTVAVALALLAVKRKRRVMLIEMNSTSRIAPLFGQSADKQEPVILAPGLTALNLTPGICFEEFVLKQIRLKILYNTFFNNSYVRNFVDAIPGLSELLMLGKIYELEKTSKSLFSSEPLYDLIIVDAPATGHGLSMLEVPSVVESVVKVGPMHRSACSMQALFSDATKTALCLVTLAEEMPVVETSEFAAALKKSAKMSFGPLFINALMSPLPDVSERDHLSDELSLYRKYYDLTRKRAQLHKQYMTDIKKRFADFERIELPFLFSDLSTPADFDSLIQVMEKT